MMYSAVIVAAGSSRRAGFDKLAAPLCGAPVMCHSVRAFAQAGARNIILVCPKERWEALKPWEYAEGVPLVRVEGGERRQDSVWAGLCAIPEGSEWVAVHDAARPLITAEGIKRCLEAARVSGAAACAHPIVDTLKRADEKGRVISGEVSRDGLWGMETPQIFRLDLLRKAYERARADGRMLTDEVSAMEGLGVVTQLVRVQENDKITLPGDLERAERLYRAARVSS